MEAPAKKLRPGQRDSKKDIRKVVLLKYISKTNKPAMRNLVLAFEGLGIVDEDKEDSVSKEAFGASNFSLC